MYFCECNHESSGSIKISEFLEVLLYLEDKSFWDGIFALLRCYLAYLVVSYRHFGSNYRPHLQGKSNKKNGLLEPWTVWSSKTGPIVCPIMSVTTNLRCVTSHKSEDLIYLVAELQITHKCFCDVTPHRMLNTGCFTTWGQYCRRWFPKSLWSKKFI